MLKCIQHTQPTEESIATQYCRVLVTYPGDGVALQELWLTIAAHHLKKVSYYLWLAQKKDKNSKKVRLLGKMYHFHTIVKLKSL
jgi:hypothetical protein